MKPDIGSIGGVIVALGMILFGQYLEGGHASSLVGIPAALIVLGGTFGACMVQFPLDTTIAACKSAKNIFFSEQYDHVALVNELVEFATISRKEGVLALQKPADAAKDPFMKKALQLIVDGTDEKVVAEMLEMEMATKEGEAEGVEKWYEAVGGYAPTVGIIGAVMGLIHVMENLDKPENLGSGIAVAFVATVYGVAAANLFALPAANKLKSNAKGHAKSMQMTIAATLAIQQGENPNQLKEILKSYLSEKEKEQVK